MPVNFLPIAGAVLSTLQQTKLEKAQSGIKTYTKPKTLFGKLIGGVSGRNAASQQSDMYKSNPLSEKVLNSMAPRSAGFPVSGGIDFGGESTKKSYLPFYIVTAVVLIYALMRRKGGRKKY